MESPVTELIKRLNHTHPIRAECFELRAMLVDQPDLIVWRKNADRINHAKRSMVSLDGLAGFAVIEKNARICLYDQAGKFVASETKLPAPHIATAAVSIDLAASVETAKLVLKTPYLLEASHVHVGAAVNIRANLVAITRLLLAGKNHEYHLARVSWAATGGGDAVFLDLANLPNAAADIFLEQRLALKAGDVLDWRIFDQQMLLAVQSYRQESFAAWLIQASGSRLERAEVARRLALLDPKARHQLLIESLSVLLPHIIFFTAEDLGRPEELDQEALIHLPDSALRILT